MTCPSFRIEIVKPGFYANDRAQRYKSQQCGKPFDEPKQKPFGEDVRLPADKVAMAHSLLEGSSMRGTARLCDPDKRNILKLFLPRAFGATDHAGDGLALLITFGISRS